jgi:hypothetical protein
MSKTNTRVKENLNPELLVQVIIQTILIEGKL